MPDHWGWIFKEDFLEKVERIRIKRIKCFAPKRRIAAF